MVNRSVINSVNNYISEIPEELNIRKVFLFDSYAKGTAKEESDIDIALVFWKMKDFFQVQKQLMRLRRKIDLRIEPHPIDENDFNNSNPFASEILKNGIEIFSKS